MTIKKSAAALTVLSVALLATSATAHAATQTMTGIISDSMCVAKHMMPGRSDAECIKECVKAGSNYILVVGNKSYVLKGKTALISSFAGKHVTLQGTVDQKTITVDSIH